MTNGNHREAELAALAALGDLDPVNRDKILKFDGPVAWMPSGDVLREFILAPDPVTCIMGPWGSGKTTGGFIKGLLCSCVVPPSPEDGVSNARGVAVRDTYRNLEMNTIPSWHERFPTSLGTWRGGGGGEPGKHVIDFELAPGDILHLEVIFAAIGDHNVKSFCDGFQVNWCFANAMDALPPDFISFMWPRTGRWPPPQHRPLDWKRHVFLWRKLFGDMNAPDIDNWTYGDGENKRKGFVENVPRGWRLFTQPGGLDPKAENKQNLVDGYYEDLVEQNEEWWNNRFVHNKFGYSRAGEPVYPEWNDQLHAAAAPLKFNPKLPLHIGLDAGRDPRAVAGQRPLGRLHVLRELIPAERMGAKKFGKLLSEWLAQEFPDALDVQGWADPSSAYPTQDSGDDNDEVWIDTVRSASGISIKPAPSNALTARLEAVRQPLTEITDGRPAFQLDPRCRVLRRGFNSGYKFGKVRVRGEERTADVPLKNIYSHPHDGLQYLALGSGDYRALRARKRPPPKPEPEPDYHPHAF